MVSKRQIAFESKAQADEKAQHTREYVSILKRSATQLSDARWGFETTSMQKPAAADQTRAALSPAARPAAAGWLHRHSAP
jgi:hypothetical protein